MTPKQRLLCALRRGKPDRVPATVHQWQPYHLTKYLDGMDALAAFRHFDLDASIAYAPMDEPVSPEWRIEREESTSPEGASLLRRRFHTPGGTLTDVFEIRPDTAWIVEHLVKRPEDVDLIDKYMPVPRLDRDAVAREYDRVGDTGILRGFIWGLQGGCWQHACELYGLQDLILATRRNPDWVHHFLRILQTKKLRFIEESLSGAKYDLIETGGGASSSTCISPKLHREFCLPYDREQHDALHAIGLPAVYHTCGGMMPLLEIIVENHCDASETLTPPGMGGDARPAEIKQRIGDQVCLIGGVNQGEVLDCGTHDEVRAEVFRLFSELGPGGGYIMSPSDHFFETPPDNLQAYAEAARECRYD
jgi:uroporphyrinogen-III decarboxylase